MSGMDLSIFFEHPEEIGRQIGFNDLAPLHGRWIRKMVFLDQDYTLQAHRGSFKSSCLAVAIAILLVYYPDRNIIFLRKTDNDVSEMLGRVGTGAHLGGTAEAERDISEHRPVDLPGERNDAENELLRGSSGHRLREHAETDHGRDLDGEPDALLLRAAAAVLRRRHGDPLLFLRRAVGGL